VAFTFSPLERMPDVVLIESTRHGDARGWFIESYKSSVFAEQGITLEFRQDNHSFSADAGTLRGLHYQAAPYGQGKLVRVIAGEIFDVAVDMRSTSITFGRWVSTVLNSRDARMLWIPEGFAHGFQTLMADTHVLYKTTAEYSASHEGGIRWDDPQLGIEWPIAGPILSDRDRKWPVLSTVPTSPGLGR
jgi:dTDP-4-dehydrorhamnose 3,5-epimerase